MNTMKALTISQPYAELIASGVKWVENRTWPTNYRGPLAIHAGKGSRYLTKDELTKYQTGCIVATANLVGCYSLAEIERHATSTARHSAVPGTLRSWIDFYEHEHTEGPFCWILADVDRLDEPKSAKGAQGLWEIQL